VRRWITSDAGHDLLQAPLPAKMRASAEKKLASAETFLKKEKARAEKPAPAGNPRK